MYVFFILLLGFNDSFIYYLANVAPSLVLDPASSKVNVRIGESTSVGLQYIDDGTVTTKVTSGGAAATLGNPNSDGEFQVTVELNNITPIKVR